MQKIALQNSVLSCKASEASAVNSGETSSSASLVSRLFTSFHLKSPELLKSAV